MHKDFNDLLSAFNAHSVRYLIVGGYAYARYTEPRTTKDLGLFIRPDPDNAVATYKALAQFGAYLADATIADFAKPGTVFQIGVATPPHRHHLQHRLPHLRRSMGNIRDSLRG